MYCFWFYALLWSMSLSVSKSWLDSMSGTLNRQDDLTVTFQLENCDSVDVIENKLNEFSETYHNEQNIQKRSMDQFMEL